MRNPDTAHQRDYYRQWISCVSEIPDFETFQSFRHENLLGTGARTVRGWGKDIRQLARSTRSDWTEILWGQAMVLSPCMHYNNYTFNWGEKVDSAHSLHLSYIPVLYIPRILICVQTRTTPACHGQHWQKRKREREGERESVDLCGNQSGSRCCPSFHRKKKKETPAC